MNLKTVSKKLILFTVATVVFLVWLIGGMFHYLTTSESAENLPMVTWLPKTASDVSYYLSYSQTAYEFKIDEDEFRKWSEWQLQEIVEPVTITRYKAMTKRLREFAGTPDGDRAFEQAKAERYATVSHGLFYHVRRGNGGGIDLVYDRESGKGYCWHAPR